MSKTSNKFLSEVRIVLDGLLGEDSIADALPQVRDRPEPQLHLV